jgi:osmoprotectant transport system permease protein
MRGALCFLFAVALSFERVGAAASNEPVRIGSKRFTESYVLGEIAHRLLSEGGYRAEHRQGMGGTIILWEALRTGQILAYPEYTGTIREEILKGNEEVQAGAMREALALRGVGMTEELGFNNTYALVMRRERADELGVSRISDLRRHPGLRAGFTHEFLQRQDGWGPLSAHYGLALEEPRGIDHALGYTALQSGAIDLKDAYSTDAKIEAFDLVGLEDDLGFFPQYKAVFLYHLEAPPGAVQLLRRLEGQIDETLMIRLNAVAEQTKSYQRAAGLFFGDSTAGPTGRAGQLRHWIGRHLVLVGISLTAAVLVGIPLGIWASRPGWRGQVILGGAGVIQTIPALALLALLVPLPFLGISVWTAIVALFLYSLLPIIRNTATGLQEIPASLRESAVALGLEPGARLRKIFLPMAARSILAGIKTSAVINVGTATLAALIGAGGLGEPIISGLNLNDHGTILLGAIPAAILALLVQIVFEACDRFFISQGLRMSGGR